MSEHTAIDWADHSWNPLRGTLGQWHCVKVSPGCEHCYAAALNHRRGGPEYAKDADTVRLHEPALANLATWRAGRVFVCSMTDIGLPGARPFLPAIFAAMLAAPKHTYLVLTKRPALLAVPLREAFGDAGPPANWWIGTSIESDEYVWRANELRAIPAAVRFISAEPLLGPLPSLDLAGIDWLITGGESGHHHRPFDPAWASDLRDRCQVARVAFFHKQNGGRTPKAGGRLLDGRTWDAYPTAPVTALDTANALAALGISTVPVMHRTKQPPIKWTPFQTRVADVSERFEWFHADQYSLAVVAGASDNLVPLDYDGPNGFESHAAVYPILRTYPRIRTGSGKVHVWIRTAAPVTFYKTTAPDGSVLEVRGGKHITVCPPSIHPSGGAYTWEVPPWRGIPIVELASIGLEARPVPVAPPSAPAAIGDRLSPVTRGAIAAALVEHWRPTYRKDLTLAVAGWLASHGTPELDAQAVLAAVVVLADDDSNQREMRRWIAGTYTKAATGEAVAGWAALTDATRPLVSSSSAAALDHLIATRGAPAGSFGSNTTEVAPISGDMAALVAEKDRQIARRDRQLDALRGALVRVTDERNVLWDTAHHPQTSHAVGAVWALAERLRRHPTITTRLPMKEMAIEGATSPSTMTRVVRDLEQTALVVHRTDHPARDGRPKRSEVAGRLAQAPPTGARWQDALGYPTTTAVMRTMLQSLPTTAKVSDAGNTHGGDRRKAWCITCKRDTDHIVERRRIERCADCQTVIEDTLTTIRITPSGASTTLYYGAPHGLTPQWSAGFHLETRELQGESGPPAPAAPTAAPGFHLETSLNTEPGFQDETRIHPAPIVEEEPFWRVPTGRVRTPDGPGYATGYYDGMVRVALDAAPETPFPYPRWDVAPADDIPPSYGTAADD